jgi:hypothetical protein
MKIAEEAPIFGLLFSNEKIVLILTKHSLGYIFGDFFFTNSSGHPGHWLCFSLVHMSLEKSSL